MKNRLTFLLILVSLLGSFFFYRYVLLEEKPFPKIEDRLPDEEYIGKINVIDLVDGIKPLLFKNQVPYRDFIASDFILSQTKNAGINLQKPVYFYISNENEIGALISLSDSSKVPKAITRIKSLFDVQDTIINSNVIYKFSKYNLYFAYERNWMFIYQGNQFVKNYFQVKFADHTSMKKCWKNFLADNRFNNENLIIYARPKALTKQRLNFASFSFRADSSHIFINTIISDTKKFPVKIKQHGPSIIFNKEKVKNYLNLHLDLSELKSLKKHFIYEFTIPYANKINFPLIDFVQAWNGDLSVNVGGKMSVLETFVETEFDADFNSIDVVKTQRVEKDMFSGIMSTTPNFQPFMNKLFAKGYLRKTGDDYYFLMSPPVKIITKPELFYVFTGNLPKIDTLATKNEGKIRYDGADFIFNIDSISHKDLFMNLIIPYDYLKRRFKS
jgi:hypothetical protein